MYSALYTLYCGLSVLCTLYLVLWIALCRAVGFAGECSEAVYYALHYLLPLVTLDGCKPGGHGPVSGDQVVRPCLELPDVFELLHHANQVSPMLLLEAVIGGSFASSVAAKFSL